MATLRVTKSIVARCPWCPWSKLIFGTTKWELQLQAARETVAHCTTFKLPTSKMIALLVILTMIAGPAVAQERTICRSRPAQLTP